MGVGHPGHKDAVPGYVLRDFPKADQGWLDDMMRGISDGAVALAEGDKGRFMNAVSLRTAPPRSSKTSSKSEAPAEKTAPQAEAAPDEAEQLSPLQRLIGKFR